MAALVTWIRRVVGAALLAWSAWQIVKPVLHRSASSAPFHVGTAVGAWGERYELRVEPLDPDELAGARQRQRELYAQAWTPEDPDELLGMES